VNPIPVSLTAVAGVYYGCSQLSQGGNSMREVSVDSPFEVAAKFGFLKSNLNGYARPDGGKAKLNLLGF
jgi:hypothetical protein